MSYQGIPALRSGSTTLKKTKGRKSPEKVPSIHPYPDPHWIRVVSAWFSPQIKIFSIVVSFRIITETHARRQKLRMGM
jgi:hypothetical protein